MNRYSLLLSLGLSKMLEQSTTPPKTPSKSIKTGSPSIFSRYSDSQKESQALAEGSIKKLAQLGLHSNPIHFMLMFEWLSESDAFFHAEIEQALQTNSYNNATAEALFINLIGQMLYNSIPSQEVESLLARLQIHLDSCTKNSQESRRLLQKNVHELTKLDLPDALKTSLTDSILPSVDALIAESEQLKEHVTKAGLEIALLKKELERVTSVTKVDELTNIANRSGFNEILNSNIQQAKKEGSRFALILIDLDRFTDINDNYGYLIGDSVLRYAARLIGNEVGLKGSYARFDGQQFMITLPNSDYEAAMHIADSIRRKFASQPLQIKSNKKTLQPSISAGLSLYKTGENAEDLITRVTALLTEAKEQGRNRVCGDHRA